MFKHLKVAAVALAVTALAAGLWLAYEPAAPVRDGEPDEFWYAATRVRLVAGRTTDPRVDALYQEKDGHFLYYRTDPREQVVYRVRTDEVRRDLGAMLARIGDETAGAAPWVRSGVRLWEEADPGRDDVVALLRCTGARRTQWLEREQPGHLSLVRFREAAVKDRWSRARWYPRVAAGELLYLTGLVLFAAWPWLRKGGPVSWAVHPGLTPVLLFLPFWLGYGSRSFTPVDLKGGIVYPRLLAPFGFLPCPKADESLLQALPQVLEPFSPLDVTSKAVRVLRGGPLVVLGLGAVVGGTTYGLRNMRRLRLRALRRRLRRKRQEDRARVEERMREWEDQRKEVLAEVRRLLEEELLPPLERRLREDILRAPGPRGWDGGFAPEGDPEFEDARRRPARDEFPAPALQLANDFPFPFDKTNPRVAERPGTEPPPPAPAPSPGAAAPPAESTGGNGSPGEKSAAPEAANGPGG
jgi:hypothetical protein